MLLNVNDSEYTIIIQDIMKSFHTKKFPAKIIGTLLFAAPKRAVSGKLKGVKKMQHYKKSLMITLVIDRICIAVWIACLFLVPQIARWYDMYSNKESIFIQLVILLYLAMIPAAIILVKINTLLSNIQIEKVFEHDNVKCLKIISYCCFVIAVLAAIMIYWRILAFVVVVAFGFVGLLLRVLKNVFEQAVVLREENDLTV